MKMEESTCTKSLFKYFPSAKRFHTNSPDVKDSPAIFHSSYRDNSYAAKLSFSLDPINQYPSKIYSMGKIKLTTPYKVV